MPVGINPVAAPERGKSTLEQIAMGVDVASKILGTGIDAYETFGLKRPKYQSEAKKDIAQAKLYETQAADYPKDKELDNQLKQKKIQMYDQLLGGKGPKSETNALKLEAAKYGAIPKTDRDFIENLSSKSATSTSVMFNLENELENFKKARKDGNDDLAVSTGQGMLKQLNSPDNPDAIGREESERIGGYLIYRKGNLFEPGAFIGRDLDAFEDQVENKLAAMRASNKQRDDTVSKRLKAHGITPKGAHVVDGVKENEKLKDTVIDQIFQDLFGD